MIINCEYCGVKFNKPYCHIKRNKHHFCSRKCRYKWQRLRMFGENNPMWKGENVGYVALHYFIKKRLPKPQVCSKCGKKKRLDLANKSREYSRDINDWMWLCRSCHNFYDRSNKKEWKFKKVGTNIIRK